MDNAKTGRRIRLAREKRSMSQEELGDRLGLNKSTIQRYESGQVQRIKQPILENMARILNVDADWLTLKTDDPEAFCETSNISYVIDSDRIYSIPVFESVSAGFGAYAGSEIVDYIPVVINNRYDVDDTIAIKVKGDSMYPKIEDGDTIVVRRQTSVDSGDIAVVLLDNDEGLVKTVVYGSTWIELRSLNEKYPVQRFAGAEVTRLRVVGKVMQIIKTL